MTLVLALLVRFAVPLIGEASLLVTMLTPAVATVLMLVLLAPEGGVRHGLDTLGLTRAGPKGWPLAIGAPVLIHAVGLAILVAAGLTSLTASGTSGPSGDGVANFAIGLVISTLLALAEEVGWRGYMLPRLTGIGVVAAMLLVGFLHGLWHMPWLLTTDYYHPTGNPWIVAPLFLLTLTLAGVFYGFLRIWTGSVWPVAVAHASANMAWDFIEGFGDTVSAGVGVYRRRERADHDRRAGDRRPAADPPHADTWHARGRGARSIGALSFSRTSWASAGDDPPAPNPLPGRGRFGKE